MHLVSQQPQALVGCSDHQGIALRSELIFWHRHCRVVDRGSYVAVKCLRDPEHYWGNLLFLRTAPRESELDYWIGVFDAEFAELRPFRHRLFAWDGTLPAEPFLARLRRCAFEPEQGVCLATTSLRPPKHTCDHLDVRTIETAEEWEETLEIQVASRSARYRDIHNYRAFFRRQIARYQALIREHRGGWYGAFLGGIQVANLGIFSSAGLARFQEVVTHPLHRGRGVCGTLMYEAARLHRRRIRSDRFVVVVSDVNPVHSLYASMGFSEVGALAWACQFPHEEMGDLRASAGASPVETHRSARPSRSEARTRSMVGGAVDVARNPRRSGTFEP